MLISSKDFSGMDWNPLLNSLQNSHPSQTDKHTAKVHNRLKHAAFPLVAVAELSEGF